MLSQRKAVGRRQRWSRSLTPVKPAAVELAVAARMHRDDLEAAGRTASYRDIVARVLSRYETFLTSQGRGATPTIDLVTAENARRFLLWLRDEHVTINTLTGQAQPKGSRALNQHAIVLKGFSRFLMREGLVAHDPLDNFRAPKMEQRVVEAFTPEQIKRLLKAADGHSHPERNRAIIYFLLATGVRSSELCSLKLADLDLRERRAKVHGKGNKWRMVNFDATTTKMLVKYKALRGEGGAPEFFLARWGDPLNRGSLGQLIKRLGEISGVGEEVRCSPHSFRHSYAIASLRANPGALLHLQQQLGHSDLAMTRRYATLSNAEAPLAGPGVIDFLGLGGRR